MSKVAWVASLAVCMMALMPVARAADTIEAVEKEITAQTDKLNACTAEIEIERTMPAGSVKGTGTVEFLKKDGVLLYRTELNSKVTMGEQTREHKTLSVFDGTDGYVQTDSGDGPKVIKTKPEMRAGIMPSGKLMFEQFHKHYDMAVLPEESLEGKPVYVLELKPKAGIPGGGQQGQGVSKAYFAKDTGLMQRMITLDSSGKPLVTSIYKNYNLNPQLDPARFKYTPPEGAKIVEPPAPPPTKSETPAPAPKQPESPAPAPQTPGK